MSLLELFCHVDDFCRQFVPEWLQLQLTSGGDPASEVHAVGFERNHDDSDLVPFFPPS